jgi:hypothetical protein
MNRCEFVNGAEGISDPPTPRLRRAGIGGKAATGSGKRAGKRVSFKFVSLWQA